MQAEGARVGPEPNPNPIPLPNPNPNRNPNTNTNTNTNQAVFIEALAKTGQELVFFIHGYSVQTKSMVESTDTMQKNFNAKARKPDVDQALVVPVDWACAELPWWNLHPRYQLWCVMVSFCRLEFSSDADSVAAATTRKRVGVATLRRCHLRSFRPLPP